ncbi:MAG: Ig-like domain-containing protein [Exilibacterium sp.]
MRKRYGSFNIEWSAGVSAMKVFWLGVLLLISAVAAALTPAPTISPQPSKDGNFVVTAPAFEGPVRVYWSTGEVQGVGRGSQAKLSVTGKASGKYTYSYYQCQFRSCVYCEPGSCPRTSHIATAYVVKKPGLPGAFTLPSLCRNGKTLKWGAASGANRYHLQVSTNGGKTWRTVFKDKNKTTYKLQGIYAGRTRLFRVQASYKVDGHSSDGSGWRQSKGCVSNTAPTATIKSPSNSVRLVTEPITLKATARDAQSDAIDRVAFNYKYDDGNTGLIKSVATPDKHGVYSAIWTPEMTGAVKITARAADKWYKNQLSPADSVSLILHEKPTAAISSPKTKSRFEVGKTVTLTANASDDGSISKVEFFENGSFIGRDNSSPYTNNWPVTSKGKHSLTAIATDNHGVKSESSPVVVITGYEIRPPENPPGNFKVDTGTTNTTGEFTLSWGSVTNASSYLLKRECLPRERNCDDDGWKTLQNNANKAIDITGLASGMYPFRLWACNEKGCSDKYTELTVTVTLPTPQRPGKTWLKTRDVCSEGATSSQSTGTFTLCWEDVAGSPTHYVVQEKAGAGSWGDLTEVSASRNLEVTLSRTTNDYRYRVMACNRTDNVCSAPGGELLLTVIDTPQPFAAAVACDNPRTTTPCWPVSATPWWP